MNNLVEKGIIKDLLILYKNLGETPLERISRFKSENIPYQSLPITYAGRLDPMAEGLLICLVGEECKNKEKYLALDKEYEFEILIGFATDTHDILGLIRRDVTHPDATYYDFSQFQKKFIGKSKQVYPAYSSKTIRGKQLHTLSRAGLIGENELPSREVEIFDLKEIGKKKILRDDLLSEILRRIDLVKGDFRQELIKDEWKKSLRNVNGSKKEEFEILKIKMSCSSGTYVRALVRDLSKILKIPMCTYSIVRTKVGYFELNLTK